MKKVQYTPYFLLLVLLTGCVDTEDYDFNTLEEIELSPTYALPLTEGELGLQDLLSPEDSATLGVREDDVFFFEYEEHFETQDLTEEVEIPNVSVRESLRLPVNITVPPNSQVQLPVIEGLLRLQSESQFRMIRYKGGVMEYTATSTLSAPVALKLRFPEVTRNGEVLSAEILTSTSQEGGQTQLSGFEADLSTAAPGYNVLPFQIELTAINNTDAPITLMRGEHISTDLELRAQEFSYIEGFFGDLDVQLPQMILPIGPFDEILKYDLNLAEMEMDMRIYNGYGVPIELSFPEFVALNEAGQELEIETSPMGSILLEAAGAPGEQSASDLEVVNGNELIRHDPSEIRVLPHAALNEGSTEGSNFITDQSELAFDLFAEIPLIGSFQNLEIRDTLDADLRDSFEELDIQRLTLNTRLVNQFPLQGDFQIYLMDEQQQVMDSLLFEGQTDIIRPSTVTEEGDLQEPGIYDEEIVISTEKFEALQRTVQIIIAARLNTVRGADDQYRDVRFKSQYTIDIDLGILAAFNTRIEP